jgi:hypothetical protein
MATALRDGRFCRVPSVRGAVEIGVAYGALVWLVMAFVVLGLNHIGSPKVSGRAFWTQLGIHMVCVGLPIALIVLLERRDRRDALRSG